MRSTDVKKAFLTRLARLKAARPLPAQPSAGGRPQAVAAGARARGSRPILQPPELEPGAADVRRRLGQSGASRALIEQVLAHVQRSGAGGTHAIDAAAHAIGAAFPTRRSPRRPRASRAPNLFVFVGPAGSGKTTTLAKLGRKLRSSGRRVVFASLDPVGLSALETVGGTDADIDRAEIPLVAVRGAPELRRVLRDARTADVVLLDTPGFSPRDQTGITALAAGLAEIEGAQEVETYLVLPASASRSSLELCRRAFAALAPSGLVVTKLDETAEPAAALELALRAELEIAFLCDGQDVRADLHRPTPGHYADLLLRGRLA